jgi:hypothetical protein
VEPGGDVIDDGDIDKEAAFEVDAEGELTTDTTHEVRCLACAYVFEVGDPDQAVCPACRRRWVEGEYTNQARPAICGPEEEAWDWDEEDEFYAFLYLCPFCHDYGDLDGPAFTPLHEDWVVCCSCGAAFHHPELFAEAVHLYQPWRLNAQQQTQSTRHIITSRGRGYYRPIQQAIDDSGAAAILRLEPGVYSGDVQTDGRRLTIVAAGAPGSVRLEGNVEGCGGSLRLRGVTLSKSVKVFQVRLTLVDCTLSGAEEAGVIAVGDRTRVVLRRCNIENGSEAGVVVQAARVRLQDCRLQGNGCGVEVGSGGLAWLRRCHIAGNRGDGLLADSTAAVFLRDCQLADNDGTGLWLSGSRAVVTGCTISGSGDAGIHLGPEGALLLRQCDIRHGRSDGVRLEQRARAYVRGCVVENNHHRGFSVDRMTRAVVKGCRIAHNGANWDVQPGARLRTASQGSADELL